MGENPGSYRRHALALNELFLSRLGLTCPLGAGSCVLAYLLFLSLALTQIHRVSLLHANLVFVLDLDCAQALGQLIDLQLKLFIIEY